jgi:hypothetical protein
MLFLKKFYHNIKKLKMKKLVLFVLLFAAFSLSNVQAQGERAPSPSAKVEQKVGLTDITIEYSRPGVKDRKIFAADGLVPFGKRWRTGANSATKITFSDAVKIGDGELAAGSYAILTTPNAESWDIHFFPHEGTRWSTYREAEPAVTVRAESAKMDVKVESFLIAVDELRDYSATLVFAWDNTVVSVPFKVK